METTQQVVTVLAVLGLLGGALWVLRHKGMAQFSGAGIRRKAARRMELVERLPLGPHHSLQLVRVADKTILVALSPSGCTVLDNLTGVSLEADR